MTLLHGHLELQETQFCLGSKLEALRDKKIPQPFAETCSHLSPLLAVWKVTVSWEATGAETFPRIWVFWPLKAKKKREQRAFFRIFWMQGVQAVIDSNNDEY